MEFEWNSAKSEENVRRRGFDFAFASQMFNGLCVERADARRDYGERRMLALGVSGGLALTVVFTDRVRADNSVVRRIISARLSNRSERLLYGQTIEVHE